MLLMSALSFALFALFMSYPVQKTALFIGTVFLGGWSLSLVFTFLAAIAAKAQQNAAIMAILSLQGAYLVVRRASVELKTAPVALKPTPAVLGRHGH